MACPDAPDAPDAPASEPVIEAKSALDNGAPWQRLDPRMIWVDALRVCLSLLPAAIALFVVGVEASAGTVWPVAAIAVWGVGGSATDVVRWVTTRYRLTEEHVERRTGLFVRTYRSIRRDRIRSVDTRAKLLQRMARLRQVTIGAGQMNTAMESALVLNALSLPAAERLRQELTGTAAEEHGGATETDHPRLLGRLRWWWVFYNVFNIWAYFMAAGLIWGAYAMTAMFGLDPGGWISGLADWQALGLGWTIACALAVTGLLGTCGLAVSFFTEHAYFRLERVVAGPGTVLRTSQGFFKTREINRDESRLRGIALSEPLLWRWMKMADTNVITTGLSMWSTSATILPRGPKSVAQSVAVAVLEDPDDPLGAPLTPHPGAALRRRLVWAAAVTGSVTGLLGWLGATTALASHSWWVTALVLAPLAVLLAVVGYKALGHTLTSRYLVVRSGAVSRATAVLRRDAVSGVRVRQSLFQRRLGLGTVMATTAAGYGGYQSKDMAAGETAAFAAGVLPGHVEPFLLSAGDLAPTVPESRAG